MKNAVVPYLQVVAGMVGAICLWLSFVALISDETAPAVLQLVFAAGLVYLGAGMPIRKQRARLSAEHDALRARADRCNAAFLAGDPAAFAPPPELPAAPLVRGGVVVAAVLAAVLVLVGIIGDVTDGLDYPSTTSSEQSTP